MSNSVIVFESGPSVLIFGGGPQGPTGPAGGGEGGGSGDFVGPSSSVDNALVRFNGTTGKLGQGGAIILDDNGNLSGVASIRLTNGTNTVTLAVGIAPNGQVELSVSTA